MPIRMPKGPSPIRIRRRKTAVADGQGDAERICSMSLRIRRRRADIPPILFPVLALLALGGCSSIGDFGRLDEPAVTDDIHSWVGEEAAVRNGGLVSA
jgi:hypothetical protein